MKIKRNQTNAMHTFHQASKQEVCDLGLIASQIASLRLRDAMKKMKIAESKEQRWYKIKPPHQQTHKDNLTGQQRAKVRAAQYLKRSKATENPTAAPKWYHDHAIKAENLSKRRSTKLSKDQKKTQLLELQKKEKTNYELQQVAQSAVQAVEQSRARLARAEARARLALALRARPPSSWR